MITRLQVLLSEEEVDEIRRPARRERLTVGEWARRALRDACSFLPVLEPRSKLRAVRQAAGYSFPTAEIDQMLAEIERGCRR